jgi:hypothetical protein
MRGRVMSSDRVGTGFAYGLIVGILVMSLLIGGTGAVPEKGKKRLEARYDAALCEHYLMDHATTELDSLRIITTMPNCIEIDS